MKNLQSEHGVIRLPKVLEIYPVGKSTLYRKIREGKFPKPYKLGPNTCVWSVEEVNAALAAAMIENQEKPSNRGKSNE